MNRSSLPYGSAEERVSGKTPFRDEARPGPALPRRATTFGGCRGARSRHLLELFLELVAGPVQVRLHRAQREVHDLRDLVVRVALHVPQEDYGPVLGAQLPDRGLDLTPELTVLEQLL